VEGISAGGVELLGCVSAGVLGIPGTVPEGRSQPTKIKMDKVSKKQIVRFIDIPPFLHFTKKICGLTSGTKGFLRSDKKENISGKEGKKALLFSLFLFIIR